MLKKEGITKCLCDDGNESVESGKFVLKEREGPVSVSGCGSRS